MPSSNQHLQQANHNLHFLASFVTNYSYNDWAITVSFYTAVHVIEAGINKSVELLYCGKKIQIHHSDELPAAAGKQGIEQPINFSSANFSPHVARKILVDENFPEIAAEYNLLHREARAARYFNYSFAEYKIKLLIGTTFKKIISWSNNQLETNFDLNLLGKNC
ncbi:MAG: hypothetical protein A3G33_02695 [Omnitrophica bacterium RIFCSPLOWO2_12_FULL_44_17]|uniref:HEPN domain-containing protein n=1 Tax=Candidatus Danuiimicrobium aquiferis TaxID=1801832 RepID=A0A1G1KRJ8_9BACT|nr:MAG: hypothetical protein A3E74_08060 [Omnitrophica bacterium RIFCSPHIGHO2_12_FULL_44_12]OGW95517.1 MAG: hypothetical protein A3G33_02695 [Omnitrophica bacterium RIFCSPLOWO2_12_FULL_44_17]OGX01609.1 MAG: hypothetical protein A3J12_05790 [Omnitrophica bacterium RIFCSPLOWO2_02_FULL_44_11]